MQVYRWTLTMALSIVHRVTGMALYFGTLLLAWWLIAAASGPGAYANVQAFTGSIIGKLIVFGYTWALMHHLVSGLRHLVWDLGYGFKAKRTRGADLGGVGRRHLADGRCCGSSPMRSEPDNEREPISAKLGAHPARPRSQPRLFASGTADFCRQRVTAVAMTLLIVPVIVVMMTLLSSNQAGAAQILARRRSRSS